MGAFPIAMQTAQLLRTVVSQGQWSTLDQLLALIKNAGRQLVQAQPLELSAGNITRRVLHLVRDEFPEVAETSFQLQRSMYNLLESAPAPASNATDTANVKSILAEGIRELIDELESHYINVAALALEHIHSEYAAESFCPPFLTHRVQRDPHDARIVAHAGRVFQGCWTQA